MALADLLIGVLGLVLLGVGLWWKEPWLSLSVVGGSLFVCSVAAQFVKPRIPPGD